MRWIGDTFTSDVGWSHLETLVDIGDRMAGSAGERAAAEATRDALADYTDEAWLDEFEIQGWTRGSSAVEFDGESLESIALPRSPSGDVTAEFADLGYGLPIDFEETDVEGKVVMCASNVPSWYDRFVHRREKYYHAVEGGAAAFVFRNHVEGCLAPTGSVGTEARPIGEIPAVGVSKEVGARLGRVPDGTEVSVRVDADVHDATSQNVHATLGPDTDTRVLVTSHVDAHDIAEGAMDNGAGTAMVVELARALAARADELETGVEFVAFGAEEVGLEGSAYLADAVDPETVKVVVNNDGVVRGRDLAAYTHGFPELRAAVERVADRLDQPVSVNPNHGPHSDHWSFVAGGVPGYQVHAETGDEGRGWGHTRADTLDKLEKRNLRESAIVLTELVVDLARESVAIDHRDPDAIARELEQQDLAAGMKVTGDWPFDD
ncbi:M28 family peptidase [Halorarius litoreus]|uniref:M28 family peptidase n=1 Tax=Halorarius litoreus TaxID=2962676 RepID=UPI0020CE129E|nr:M28 family metallopeptidase [Halorarius litoreus]